MDFDYLRSFDLKNFLREHTTEDILSLNKKFGKLSPILSAQLTLYDKAREKLPLFSGNYCYFTRKSLEQSSSQPLAQFKAGLFSGNKLLDISGGLGADDWAFASSFKQVISVDNNEELNSLVRINFQKLGINNILRIDADSYEFINKYDSYDLIYLDADRRQDGKRKISLNNSEPNVLKIIDKLFGLSGTILLKLSPLIDLTYLKVNLPNIVKTYVIAYKNEVKEILALLQKGYSGKLTFTAVDLSKDNSARQFTSEADVKIRPNKPKPEKYFYEPSVSLIKSGLVKHYSIEKELGLISGRGIYLTGDKHIMDFMGRAFIIRSKMNYKKLAFRNYLKQNKIIKANIAARNFRAKPEEIKKTFNIKDGGDDYLFFTVNDKDTKLLYHCKKLTAD